MVYLVGIPCVDSSGTANHLTFMLVLFSVCTDTNVGAVEGTVKKTGHLLIIIFFLASVMSYNWKSFKANER